MTKKETIFKLRFCDSMHEFALASGHDLTIFEVTRLVVCLHRKQTTLRRLYTDDCNLELSDKRTKRERQIEADAAYIVSVLGCELEIQGDPRGNPFIIKAKDGREFRMEW